MSDRGKSGNKVLVIQTPQGAVRIDLGAPSAMPEPMAKALRIFESAIDKGVVDPLGETLHRLQQMAAEGDTAPLAAAMELMNRVMAQGEPGPAPRTMSEGTLKKLDNPENLN